jgi:very-short-patch-repair endonuclease
MKIKGKSITPAQLTLKTHLEELGVKTVFEHRFLEDRKYAFDLYDEENRIGYEADGGTWTGGHKRKQKIEDQYEKDRLAQLHGYRILRFTNRQILCGEAKKWLQEHLYPF